MTTRTKCPKCGHERTTEDDAAPPDQCPNCGVFYDKVVRPSVGGPSTDRTRRASRVTAPFTLVNLGLAFGGAALMAVGAFLPVFSWGAMSITYFKGGDGDGVFVVIAAAIVMLGAVLKSRRLIAYPALAGLVLILWGMFTVSSRLGDAKDEMARELEGNPFGGLAMSLAESASMEWGWAVMILGAVLAFAAAVVDERSLRKRYS